MSVRRLPTMDIQGSRVREKEKNSARKKEVLNMRRGGRAREMKRDRYKQRQTERDR